MPLNLNVIDATILPKVDKPMQEINRDRKALSSIGFRLTKSYLSSIFLKCSRYIPAGLKRRLKTSHLLQGARKKLVQHQAPAPLCVLPWMHAYVGATGDVHLCCIALGPENSLGNLRDQSITEIFASGPVDAIRRQMLRGEWPSQCRGCQHRESLGLSSFRQSSNSEHSVYVRQLITDPGALRPAIRSLDLRLNNICNFKCRSCGYMASNRWFGDHNLINPEFKLLQSYQGFDKEASFWTEFDQKVLPALEEITLAGGEPLLSQSQYRLLEKLIAHGKQDIRLKVVTNLSQLRFMHWDAVELWKNFPDIKLTLSLDGVGAQGEYIRYGMKYAKWVENALRLKGELPHAKRCLHFVVSIFNVINLREHYETIVQGDFVEPGTITFTFLSWPAYMSVQVLTPELKSIVERDIREWLSAASHLPESTSAQLKALIQFMNETDGYSLHGHEFVSKTRVLDRARGEDAVALFPKLKSMLAG